MDLAPRGISRVAPPPARPTASASGRDSRWARKRVRARWRRFQTCSFTSHS